MQTSDGVVWRGTHEKLKKNFRNLFVVVLFMMNLGWASVWMVNYEVRYKPLLTEIRTAFSLEKEKNLSMSGLKAAVHEYKVRVDILQYLRTKGMSLGQGLDVADGIVEESKDLPIELIMAVIKTESEFYINARSPKGAIGIMQVMPITWKEMVEEMNLDVGIQAAQDPRICIKVGCAKLRKLMALYAKPGRSDAELTKLVLSAYNAGPSGGIQPGYVSKVSKVRKEFISFQIPLLPYEGKEGKL